MLTQLSALLACSSFWIFMSSFRGALGRLAYVEANIFYFVSDSNALSTCSRLGFFLCSICIMNRNYDFELLI
ncbi:hypothetical protein NC653_041733 [Populus alba x Populus x berolinensis]|uniref:Secreted protein n=1 Tax=Populus alba x Populus x berolinensis TaxID=444605 RepID=A0AAD6L977_9ROSI|nr:hypothetical protein NC653_041733 [Populus alba x Populus x berolinensis]